MTKNERATIVGLLQGLEMYCAKMGATDYANLLKAFVAAAKIHALTDESNDVYAGGVHHG